MTEQSANPVRRRGPRAWKLAFSGTILAATGPFVFMLGWPDWQLHHDPNAVQVIATVDRVNQHCGRSGCKWWSYGHYELAGHHESDVAVAKERTTPAKAPQIVLVNPARPRDVVNIDESPNVILTLGLGTTSVGVLYLVLWARAGTRHNWPHRRKTVSP